MIEVFLDGLPSRGGTINWKESKNHNIYIINNGEKERFLITDYERNKKQYLTIEYKGIEFEIYNSNLKKGKISGILNRIIFTAPWMIRYIGVENAKKYTKCSMDKIEIVCPDCGKKKIIKIGNLYRYKSISCYCSDNKSYGEKYIFNILKQLKIKFKTQEYYNWCKFYNSYKNKLTIGIYDFVLESKKL